MLRPKVDGNHAEIVAAFRAFGWRVKSTAGLKGGWDLTVQKGVATQVTLLVEVKTKKGKPTPAQEKLKADGWVIYTVRSVEDVATLVAMWMWLHR